MKSLNRIKGVTEALSTGEVMVWRGPTIWYLYNGETIIDSSRRASGMSNQQAHQYSTDHAIRQNLEIA